MRRLCVERVKYFFFCLIGYVMKMEYDRPTGDLLVKTISVLGTQKRHKFHISEAGPPSKATAFSSFQANGKSFFMHSEVFEDRELLSKILGAYSAFEDPKLWEDSQTQKTDKASDWPVINNNIYFSCVQFMNFFMGACTTCIIAVWSYFFIRSSKWHVFGNSFRYTHVLVYSISPHYIMHSQAQSANKDSFRAYITVAPCLFYQCTHVHQESSIWCQYTQKNFQKGLKKYRMNTTVIEVADVEWSIFQSEGCVHLMKWFLFGP